MCVVGTSMIGQQYLCLSLILISERDKKEETKKEWQNCLLSRHNSTQRAGQVTRKNCSIS